MVLTLANRVDSRPAARATGTVTAGPSRPARFEPHIQGLRAVAVVSVVLYHLWPDRLSGGFVGVDVFFVISGYLICGHLLREIDETGTIRLVAFWARRIRRLIPAAMTVLIAATAFVVLVVPALDWDQNLHEIRAAALYVENWQLVANAVDYLAAENAPSLVQHFWSLSVEEQFYIAQPLLLLVAVKLFRTRRVVVPVLVGVIVLSLPYSVLLTAAQPGAAYFSTGTRAWEFAVGGLAAALGSRMTLPARVQAVLGWCGLALVGITVLLYSHATPFPGIAAGLPVAGAVLALLCGGSASRVGPRAVLSSAPLRVVGDWSYSIYLWHWPLIVAAPIVLGGPAGWKVKAAILLLTVLLAAVTKRLVEDRWRRPSSAARPWRTYAAMVAEAAAVAAATTGAAHWQAAATAELVARGQAAPGSAAERCVGVGAILNECARPYAVTDSVVPAAAADDVPWNLGIAASRSCPGESNVSAPIVHACVFNEPPQPAKTVVLVGDSHADHLIDALNAYAESRRWRFVTYTREGCGAVPSAQDGDARCRAWSAALEKVLVASHDVDAVVVSNYASAEPWTVADAAASWKRLESSGKVVVPVVDVPGMPAGTTAPRCVAAHQRDYDPCSTAVPASGKTAAAAIEAGIGAVSLNDLLCAGGRCHAVIGGQIVYLDEAHLTLHFAYSLRAVLGSRIEHEIDRRGIARVPAT